MLRIDAKVLGILPSDGATVQIGDLSLAADIADLIEIVAVIVIAVGVAAAIILGTITRIHQDGAAAFATFRRVMARGLLIGLDLLIAADIIKTVTLEPTLENVAALGLLILIRTFLTWTLLVETEGHWPWQQAAEPTNDSEWNPAGADDLTVASIIGSGDLHCLSPDNSHRNQEVENGSQGNPC